MKKLKNLFLLFVAGVIFFDMCAMQDGCELDPSKMSLSDCLHWVAFHAQSPRARVPKEIFKPHEIINRASCSSLDRLDEDVFMELHRNDKLLQCLQDRINNSVQRVKMSPYIRRARFLILHKGNSCDEEIERLKGSIRGDEPWGFNNLVYQATISVLLRDGRIKTRDEKCCLL